MTIPVHLVGSVGLDTAEEVFATAGRLLGKSLKRCPDGEVGGRRLWVSWQYPLLRASPWLAADPQSPIDGLGFYRLKLAPDVKPSDIRFGELGYSREARTSYQDFLAARSCGDLPRSARFQVSLPTPHAVIAPFVVPMEIEIIEPAYEKAMLREIERLCAAIPHADLAIQWDICIEMVFFDGGFAPWPRYAGIEKAYAEKFKRLCAPIAADVELGFHLCYGDLDAKHFVEPRDARRLVEFANLLVDNVSHRIGWIHMPVPIARDDDAYFAPLRDLRLAPGTDLFLGLVHATGGVEGTRRRMATARRHVPTFGIATECGMARSRTPEAVQELLRVHADAISE